MTGGPVRGKVHRDWPLDKHQEQVAADFIAAPQPSAQEQRAYEKGWENAIAYEELKASRAPTAKRARRERVRALRTLGHKIVPANRQAAAPARAEIHRAALRYVRYCGGVGNLNISGFVRYVQTKSAAHRTYRKSGTSRMLKDHAIRAVLKQRLGIVSKPGRKCKKP